PFRHRAVAVRMQRNPRPDRVVVVCHGNIFRSPYLAAILRPLLPDVEILSAGFIGPPRPVPDDGRAVALERHVDLSGHLSKLLNRDILRSADLVIVMDARQARHLTVGLRFPDERVIIAGDLDPSLGEGRTIRDPWGKSRDVLASTFARLDRCAASLVEMLPPGDGLHRGDRNPKS
ncbi:MAG TPA: hypothetical protein VK636_12855, partial [Gemmatimonadaceae bacterium]|nr:hypothetical protein [Gemmatimonadaceae bacterium]